MPEGVYPAHARWGKSAHQGLLSKYRDAKGSRGLGNGSKVGLEMCVSGLEMHVSGLETCVSELEMHVSEPEMHVSELEMCVSGPDMHVSEPDMQGSRGKLEEEAETKFSSNHPASLLFEIGRASCRERV